MYGENAGPEQVKPGDDRSIRGSGLHESLYDRGSVAAYGSPYITPTIVVNVTAGLLISGTLTAMAILADIAGYVVYYETKNAALYMQDINYFSLISEIGSLIYGALLFLILASTKLLWRVVHDDFCAQMALRMMVFSNFVVNMALGFLEDHFFDQDKHMKLVLPCIYSKFIGLALVLGISLVLWKSGCERYLGKQMFHCYMKFYEVIDDNIGPTSSFFEEGGCQGRLRCCVVHFGRSVVHFFQPNQQEYTQISAIDPENPNLVKVADFSGDNTSEEGAGIGSGCASPFSPRVSSAAESTSFEI